MGLRGFVGVGSLALALAACAPTVNVATREPIVIQLNIQHELRVKIEESVGELIESDEAREQVGGRGLEEDLSAPSYRDARDVSQAKAAGRIGERADGYLGIVRPGDPALAALVARVNEERRESYGQLADRHDTSLPVVATVAGERRLAAAAPGEPIMNADGLWVTTSR